MKKVFKNAHQTEFPAAQTTMYNAVIIYCISNVKLLFRST